MRIARIPIMAQLKQNAKWFREVTVWQNIPRNCWSRCGRLLTVRRGHYSSRTEESYVGWIKRYILFHTQ